MISLDQANAAHATAKDAFANDPTPANQLTLTNAAAAVAKATREAAVLAEEQRARLQVDYDARMAADAECVAALESRCAKVVGLERETYEQISEIGELCKARQLAFYQTRQLSIALGLSEPPRQPASALVISDYLQSEITRAQQSEGRNGNDSRQVSVWVQPAARVHAVRSRIA